MIRMSAVFAMMFFSASSNLAQEGPEDIISSKLFDWNNDGKADLVIIQADKNNHSIMTKFYVGKDKGFELLRAVPDLVVADEISYTGNIDIEIGETHSIKINWQPKSSGIRYYETLTIIYRKENLIVAGYDNSTFDTLRRGGDSKCSYNILTGKVITDKEIKQVKPQTIKITDWVGSSTAAQCYSH